MTDPKLERWAEIARDGTESDWQAEQADLRRYFAALSQQRAVAEGWVLVNTRQLGRWKKAAGEVADYMSRAKVSRHIYAQSELLAAEIHFELAAAPSPEQEEATRQG